GSLVTVTNSASRIGQAGFDASATVLQLTTWSVVGILSLAFPATLRSQMLDVPAPRATLTAPSAPGTSALRLDIPHSHNPIDAYRPSTVPQPNLANSPRIDALIHNGMLEIS